MPTAQFAIAATGDAIAILHNTALPVGSWSATLGEVRFGQVTSQTYTSALLFKGVTIPQGATISAATLNLRRTTSYADTDFYEGVYFHDVDDAPAIVNNPNTIRAYPMTASVDWRITSLPAAYAASPDLSSILQTIINRPGWASGNDLMAITMFTSGTLTVRHFYGYNLTYPAYLEVTWDNVEHIVETVGASDSTDGFSTTGHIVEVVGAGDATEGSSTTGRIIESIAAGETWSATAEKTGRIVEAISAGEIWSAAGEYTRHITEAVEAAEAPSAFNWGRWWRRYGDIAGVRYFLYLTGKQDGLSLITLPCTSFQARLRQGTPSYISAVVPALTDIEGNDYYAQAAARPNGKLYVMKGFVVAGELTLVEEIARVDLENIRTDQGPRSQSMTLSGHETTTWDGKYVTLTAAAGRYLSNGKVRIKSPIVDPYIRPGDTIIYGDDQFVADQVSITVGGGSQYMEVTQE